MTVVALESPTISGVSPQVVTAGTPGVTLTIKGANFDTQSALTINGTTVPTSMVSSDTLAAQVGGSALSQPTVAQLKVRNAGGVESNAVNLTVTGSGPANPVALTVTTTGVPAGQVGTAYDTTLVASGGTPGYTWTVSAGSLPAGLTLSSGGVISGTPTGSGTANFTIQVSDSGSPVQTQTVTVSMTVAPAPVTVTPLTIASTTLSGGQVGSGYSATLSANGGTPGYTWTVASGTLPAGLKLSSAGVISGTPTAAGTSSFTVTVADSGSPVQTQSVSLSLAVSASKLAIASTALSGGQVGNGYSATLSANGGTPGYTWTVASGTLPAGLTLSSAGVISGTPTAAGTSSFTVAVADSGSPVQTQSVSLSLAVSASKLTIASTGLSGGQVGNGYSATLSASGGTPGYMWTVSAGSLPAGLTLSSAGVISGTPTAAGTSSFTVAVADSGSPVQTQSVSVSITVSPSKVTIGSGAVATAQDGVSYSATLSASGGTPGYTWTISSGSLPAGLTLSSAGVISGTPTAAGTANFAVTVSDSGSPVETATASFSLVVSAPKLVITSSTLSGGQAGTGYSATLSASGGTPGYTWTITSGSLPAGLTLSTAGVISGTPTSGGTANFTVAVTDNGSPVQSASAAETIAIAAAPLTITSTGLPAGQDGVAYAASVLATGGTPAYTWSISAGSLPAGLSLAATTGVISGTPSSSGTTNFTITVSDNGSPVASQSLSTSITIAAAATPTPTTWYVRPDGGTRYSSLATNGQCDGKGDAPYSGDGGVNEHCAFNDVRLLWQDGSYSYGPSTAFPGYGWVIAGGDTVIIRGSIATGVSYRIGNVNAAGSCIDPTIPAGQAAARGDCGNQFDAAPPPPSGTAAQPTRILGENYANCSAQSARTQLHGGWGSGVLDLAGASYVDLECLDITDFSNCGRASQTSQCENGNGEVIADFASNGIVFSNQSTHITMNNIRIHGLASFGIYGPTGDGSVFKNIDIVGNAGGGWNSDRSDGQTGTGSLLVQNFTIIGNGCAEEYPIVDSMPYGDCTDDNSGGYGDGFGTATVAAPAPGWQVHFDQGTVAYNTQDGLDALHLIGGGSSMTITRTLDYGNMGQQIKVGGSGGTAINNVIVGNCFAMSEAIPGFPAGFNTKLSDYCRASDVPVVVTASNGNMLTLDFNTIYSANTIGVEVECDATYGQCDSTSLIDYRNNIFVGFVDDAAHGNPLGQGKLPTPVYVGETFENLTNPFTNPGSVFANNVTFNPRAGWTCPATGLNEVNGICGDPGLTDETWHLYGYGNMTPTAGSPVIGAGVSIPGVTTDYAGTTRNTPPAIGAYE